MIFPKGQVRHRDLFTAYTNLPALLSTLKSEKFSGTVEVEFPDNRGILFIVSGQVANAEARRRAGQKRLTGQEAVRSLLALSDRKDGTINVYRWPSDKVAMMANNLEHEILFKGLSTDFTRLDRLIMNLREAKHDGFIEIQTKEQKDLGVLFFQKGEPVDLFMTSESEASIVEKKSIPIFLENAVKQGTLLSVYRSQGKPSLREMEGVGDGSLKEISKVLQEMLSRVEKAVDQGSRKGTFIKAFKKALIEKSADYPFLDPFAGEFEYREGTIIFRGEADASNLARGIGDCLQATLLHLEQDMPKEKMLFVKVKSGLGSSLEQHREQMKRWGADSALIPFLR